MPLRGAQRPSQAAAANCRGQRAITTGKISTLRILICSMHCYASKTVRCFVLPPTSKSLMMAPSQWGSRSRQNPPWPGFFVTRRQQQDSSRLTAVLRRPIDPFVTASTQRSMPRTSCPTTHLLTFMVVTKKLRLQRATSRRP